MAGNVDELLDMLQDIVRDAKNFPLSSEKCVLEREQVLEIIEDIRNRLPIEIDQARDILDREQEILGKANRDADAVKKRAEEQVRRMVEQNAITVEAKKRAVDIIGSADKRARELQDTVGTFCERIMADTENAIGDMYAQAKESRAEFRRAINASEAKRSRSSVYDMKSNGSEG